LCPTFTFIVGHKARSTPDRPALDSGPGIQAQVSLHFTLPMGQQTNKHIKKKRRIAYHKRRNARLKAAAKTKK